MIFLPPFRLYVLRTFGKKSKRDFGELNVRIWLADAGPGKEQLGTERTPGRALWIHEY